MEHLRRSSLSSVLLFAGACSDECLQDLTAYAFDEPGPWGDTPAEVFGYTEDPVSGTLTWIGPLIEGQLDPDVAETAVVFDLILDTNSAAGVRDNLVGACEGDLQIDATLSMVTADGVLDESIPIVLMTEPGSSHVHAIVDLTDYDFAGTLDLTPGWTKHEMQLWLAWERDKPMTGAIRSGDALEDLYAVISAND